MKLVAAVLCTFLTNYLDTGVVDRFDIEIPPAGYAATPARPVLEFIYHNQELVTSICDPARHWASEYNGCALVNQKMVQQMIREEGAPADHRAQVAAAPRDVCVVVMLRVANPAMQEDLEKHEFAHCNGLYHSRLTGHGWYTESGERVY